MFVVVAIVIFGIFVSLSYTLFGSQGLTNDLKVLFENGIEKSETDNPIKTVTTNNPDGTVTIKAFNQKDSLDVDTLTYVSNYKGVNILNNSTFTEPLIGVNNKTSFTWGTRGNTTRGIDNKTLIDGYPTLKMETSNLPNIVGTPNDLVLQDNEHLIGSGETVTISFDAFSLEETPFDIRFGVNKVPVDIETVNITPSVSRYSVTLNRKEGFTSGISFSSVKNTTVWLTKIQIEKGSAATEFTPKDSSEIIRESSNLIELKVKENGTYNFKMIDSKGKEYKNKVVINKF